MGCTMLLDHHVYHVPKTEPFLLAMYVHRYFCSDKSVICLNKNMYIFRGLGYIKKQHVHYSVIKYSFYIFNLVLR